MKYPLIQLGFLIAIWIWLIVCFDSINLLGQINYF